MNLKDKVILITGSTRGIGNAIAREFIKENAKVIICGSKIENSIKAVEEIKNELNINDDYILPVGLNMKDTSNIKEVIEEIISKWGRIDVLINNAGITSNVSLLDSTDEQFREMFDINFFGVVSLTREVVKHMKETGGSIINTSSMVGTYGGRNQSAYSASKFAINGLTKSLAKELGMYNIRVNAVSPGVVGTDMVRENVSEEMKTGLLRMTPLGKMAQPKELAGIYLNSDEFDYTCYVHEYMNSYLEVRVSQNKDYKRVSEIFERIYWMNPEIIEHIELNFRRLIKKYSKQLNNYISKLQKEEKEKNNISSLKDCNDKLQTAMH